MAVFYLGARHPNTASPTGRNVNAWFDDVSIIGVPEPGSLALLGLGGLAMLIRRRR